MYTPTPLELELAAALAAEATVDPADPDAVEQAAARLYAARHALVDRWKPFACKRALQWRAGLGKRGGDSEDWITVAMLALMDAAGLIPPPGDDAPVRTRRKKSGPNNGRYDPGSGYAFPTYANWHLTKWLGEYAHNQRCGLVRVSKHKFSNRQCPYPVVVSLGDVADDLDGELATWEPTAREPQPEPPNEEQVWEAVAKVLTNPRDRLIVWLRYKRGWGLHQIGQEVGITNERVRQLLKLALAKLREAGAVFEAVA